MRDVFNGKSIGGGTLARVDEFEQFIQAKLPTDYRQFLIDFNGGLPSSDISLYRSKFELPGGSEIEVSQFFTLNDGHAVVRSLRSDVEENVGWLGMTSICIGADDFGNLICLDCETGQLEWLLLEARFSLDFSRIFQLQVSFSDFIDQLEKGTCSEL